SGAGMIVFSDALARVRGGPGQAVFIGLLCLLFGGGGALILAYQAAKGRAGLALTREGIACFSRSVWMFVPWQQVREVRGCDLHLGGGSTQRFLGLRLVDGAQPHFSVP